MKVDERPVCVRRTGRKVTMNGELNAVDLRAVLLKSPFEGGLRGMLF